MDRRPHLSLPPVPPVQAEPGWVRYAGRAAQDARAVLALGIAQLEQQAARTGGNLPDRYRLLLLAADRAAEVADIGRPADIDIASSATCSKGGEVVGVAEAARLLGVGERQARRRVEQAGGELTTSGWQIEKTELLADAEWRNRTRTQTRKAS